MDCCLRASGGCKLLSFVRGRWLSLRAARPQVSGSETTKPNEHVRKFHFLGQWVFERGDFKYVAWQPDGKCHGPLCQASELPVPESGAAPSPSGERMPTVPTLDSTLPGGTAAIAWGVSALEPAGQSGFPRTHEYPP